MRILKFVKCSIEGWIILISKAALIRSNQVYKINHLTQFQVIPSLACSMNSRM